MRVAAIIAAAGAGERMGISGRKQYLFLEGVPVLARSLNLFLGHSAVVEAIVVIPDGDLTLVRELLQPHCSLDRVIFVPGGAERQESVRRGMEALSAGIEIVCIHDAARPLASPALLERLMQAAEVAGAAIPVLPLSDTVKEIDSEGYIAATPPRERLRLAQTPQVFRREVIFEAYRAAEERKLSATDDAALVEKLGRPVLAVEGELSNIKITSPRDLEIASLMLKEAGK